MGSKMVDKFFRRVDNSVWDLMTGRVGIKTADGIATLDGEGDEAQVAVNMFDDFGVPLPAFAQNTPVEQIKNGDLIFNEGKVRGWVIKCPDEGNVAFKLLKPNGDRGEWRPLKVQTMGLDLNGAMVLRSLINTLPDGGLGNMQGMLMPMLLMGGFGDGEGEGGFGDMEKMLPLMLMSQCGMGGMGGDAANPMASMMPMMLMMKMMGRRSDGKDCVAGFGKGGGFFD
jgi:hypothetical protein